MLNTIWKIKKAELNETFGSLLISSSANKLFFKVLFILLLALIAFVYLVYPDQILTLFVSFNFSILSFELNLFFVISLITIISGNKNLLNTLNDDLVSFYRNSYFFTFSYLKEKFYPLIFICIFELLIIQSFVLSIISLQSLLFSLLIALLAIGLNILYLKSSLTIETNKLVDKFLKPLLFILGYSLILIMESMGLFNLDSVPIYIYVNIPLFLLVSNLFIYSELIFMNPQYKQLFFMYKYLNIPVYKSFKNSILYTKTVLQYFPMLLVALIFLTINGYSLINLSLFAVNSFIAFFTMTFIFHILVKLEAYKDQRNYFFYFIILELFFALVVANLILFG